MEHQDTDKHPSKGYMSQMDEKHIDEIVAMTPNSVMKYITESEPYFQQLIMHACQKMLGTSDIEGMWQNIMSQPRPQQILEMLLQKAYYEGASMAYMLDTLSQKGVHEGSTNVDTLLADFKKKISTDISAPTSDEEEARERQLREEYAAKNKK